MDQWYGAKTNPGQRVEAVGLLTHAIGANSFIIVRIMEPYWFLAAIVMMLPQIEGAQPAAEAPVAHAAFPR